MLANFDSTRIYKNRDEFTKELNSAIKSANLNFTPQIKKAILNALSAQDETADICLNSKGIPEADSNLRDTELVPLSTNISLPLPIEYDAKADNTQLVELVKDACEDYLEKEVKPHIPDAWIDYSKTKVGYEIPLNRHFYVYKPPRDLREIDSDIKVLEQDIIKMLSNITS